MPAFDDRELLDRCISGQPGAWQQFVDRFAPTVAAVARRYLRLLGTAADPSAVEDVVQEVFLALVAKDHQLLKAYDPTYSFKTYLGVLARTYAHRSVRRKRPVTGIQEDLAQLGGTVPDHVEEAEATEEREILERALGELEERDAVILRLRFLREMDYRAISEALRIPESSVGQTLFRAKKRLLERMRKLLGLMVLM